MINPLFGSEFLYHPAPLHFEGFNCNYQCYYCYAKKKQYDFSLKSYINLINKSKYDHSNLVKYLLGNGYPICISNNNDPFCKNNIENVDILEPYIYENGNNIFWQTKGGDNARILEIFGRHPKNNILYCTIEFPNDEIRKKLCPNAPSIDSRFELIREAKKMGIPVWVGISPFYPVHFENDRELLYNHFQKLISAGCKIINFNVPREFDVDVEFSKFIIEYSIGIQNKFKGVEVLQNIVPLPSKLNIANRKNLIPTIWQIKYELGKENCDPDTTPFEDIYKAILKVNDVSGFLEYEFHTTEFSAQRQQLLKFNECRGLKNMKQVLEYLYNNRRISI